MSAFPFSSPRAFSGALALAGASASPSFGSSSYFLSHPSSTPNFKMCVQARYLYRGTGTPCASHISATTQLQHTLIRTAQRGNHIFQGQLLPRPSSSILSGYAQYDIDVHASPGTQWPPLNGAHALTRHTPNGGYEPWNLNLAINRGFLGVPPTCRWWPAPLQAFRTTPQRVINNVRVRHPPSGWSCTCWMRAVPHALLV